MSNDVVATTWLVAAAWMVFWVVYAVILSVPPGNVVATLVVSTLLWVGAVPIVLHRWWSGTGGACPQWTRRARLLAVAVGGCLSAGAIGAWRCSAN